MTDGGIGAGVIVDNQMMRGIDDSFGEIGHTTLNFNGPKCRCGNRGCWETYASSDALLKQVSENMNQTTWLKQMVDSAEDLTLPLIAKAVENGDPVVEQIAIYDLGTYLGIGIANLVNTFNPELVIIHGEKTRSVCSTVNPNPLKKLICLFIYWNSLIEEKLKRLGINLPEAPRPAAEYVPARTVGNLVYTSELPSCWKKFLGNGVNMPDPQFRLMNFHLIPRWKLK